ncbi:hypothetical protein [sulfur-oxidizing endosymbiont of Gigantopelta aegis]|uniref:hypothetical protein n=1 Tax=sulfur-oxidizing endosymbiont of Gigantopelta aegis TaxID=2794934 RepID=UPI001BE4A0B7|nr:hypothetical protein [sulfur-oxidizing endosymbiont of Gigantopelta aegis]
MAKIELMTALSVTLPLKPLLSVFLKLFKGMSTSLMRRIEFNLKQRGINVQQSQLAYC